MSGDQPDDSGRADRAVDQVYGADHEREQDLAAFAESQGAWEGRDVDGFSFVEATRTGRRLDELR